MRQQFTISQRQNSLSFIPHDIQQQFLTEYSLPSLLNEVREKFGTVIHEDLRLLLTYCGMREK